MSPLRHIPRALDLRALVKGKSHFLFGPRQTGKTSLIRATLKPDHAYNLLESDTFLTLAREPQRLRQEIAGKGKLVVIDEIQKLPALLDEVQWLIEERATRFLLTGSSARKLRRAGVNLLGGRLRSRTLHPFVLRELGDKFDLLRALTYGTLPSIYLSDAPQLDLRAYVGDYLREEIAHEGLTRNLAAFSRFLEVSALCNGKMLNFTQIASDAQVARTTVHEYFAILKDTLIGFELPALGLAKKRKPLETSKFFFFDAGVARQIQGRGQVTERCADFGEAFEAWMFHELRAYADYRDAGDLRYWRTTSGFEVDFVLGDYLAVEVKSARHVTERDMRGLHAIREEKSFRHCVLVCREPRSRRVGDIEVEPYDTFLEKLWEGAYQ